jgi:hypothetical protein
MSRLPATPRRHSANVLRFWFILMLNNTGVFQVCVVGSDCCSAYQRPGLGGACLSATRQLSMPPRCLVDARATVPATSPACLPAGCGSSDQLAHVCS